MLGGCMHNIQNVSFANTTLKAPKINECWTVLQTEVMRLHSSRSSRLLLSIVILPAWYIGPF